MKKLLIICGPTAVGKSALALSLAKQLNTEIISCDSMQVYKGLNIGTAKPDINEQQQVKHHLIDIIPPDKDFSVFEYVENCSRIIEQFNKCNKTPLIVGGTGLYINSLLFSYNFSKSDKNEEIRKKLETDLQTYGNDYLYQKLAEVDKKSAEVLHKNDVKRIIRALEIYYTLGAPKSELVKKSESKYEYLLIGLNTDREELYKKINLRVDLMIENGLVDEVKNLLNSGCSKSCQSMQAIGYKEIVGYLDGEYSLQTAIEKIKQYSRNYAKRQLTYFKSIPGIIWIDTKGKNLTDQVLSMYNKII